MVRLDFLLFGYRKIEFENSEQMSRALAILLREKISAGTLDDKILYLRERDYLRFLSVIGEQNCLRVSKQQGFPALVSKALKHKAMCAATLASLLLAVLSPCVVWDVRVSGNERLSDESIIESLESVGFGVGDLWYGLNRSAAETALMEAVPEISWININRRGGVAYVEVIESDLPPKSEEHPRYTNIVAERDCIISEITVISGHAAVSVGEVVKKGDVLISGVIPDESGGGFCFAEGSVKGIVDDEISVDVARVYTKKSYGDGIKSSVSIEIFDFSINIFKIYRNFDEKCDIIENNKNYYVLGKTKLPIRMNVEYSIPYTEEQALFDDAELSAIAGEKMREELLLRVQNSELLRASSTGGFSDDGYYMKTKVTVIEEIGISVPFSVES